MKTDIAQNALESFLSLFDAKLVIKNIDNENIYYGTCLWDDDDDTQEIKWINIYNDASLNFLSKVCNYLIKNSLNKNDKIIISEKKLINRLMSDKWNDYEIDLSLEVLLSFSVSMYDDNEYADSFTLHF